MKDPMPDQPLDWRRPETLYTVLCRPALPKDTPDVLELTRTIWDGEDYVPHVWAEWLADDQGVLAAAEYGPRVVGLGKLTRLGEDEWWMEGLRVHPQYEGRGIASRLHEYLLGHWQEHCAGVIRLSTASFRAPVHHLCQRTGFDKIAELTIYRAEAIHGETASIPLAADEADAAYQLASASETFPLTAGLLDLGWQWARLSAQRIRGAAQDGRAWWSSSRGGLLLARDDEEENALVAQLVAGTIADLPELLSDFRKLGAAAGYPRLEWLAPLDAGVESALGAAGFTREWDASLIVYEKSHPDRPPEL